MTMQSSVSTEQDLTTIYMSVEVSRSSWVVGIYCPATDNKIGIHKLEPSAANELIKLAHKAQGRAGPDSRVVLCHEISYEGFWLARYLAEWAPDVVVIDPASLQVDRRAKSVKTDRIVATRMIRTLKAWCTGDSDALSRVRVPSMADEDRRRLLRERDALVAERRRLCNRIKWEPYFYGNLSSCGP